MCLYKECRCNSTASQVQEVILMLRKACMDFLYNREKHGRGQSELCWVVRGCIEGVPWFEGGKTLNEVAETMVKSGEADFKMVCNTKKVVEHRREITGNWVKEVVSLKLYKYNKEFKWIGCVSKKYYCEVNSVKS